MATKKKAGIPESIIVENRGWIIDREQKFPFKDATILWAYPLVKERKDDKWTEVENLADFKPKKDGEYRAGFKLGLEVNQEGKRIRFNDYIDAGLAKRLGLAAVTDKRLVWAVERISRERNERDQLMWAA